MCPVSIRTRAHCRWPCIGDYREKRKVKMRTLAEQSAMPEEQIDVPQGAEGPDFGPGGGELSDFPCNVAWQVAAVLGTLKKMGLKRMLIITGTRSGSG